MPTYNSEIAAVRDENRRLRLMLALRVAGAKLYTDDGEMQDGSDNPPIDFRRDSVAELERKLMDRGLRRFCTDMERKMRPKPKAP